MPRDIADGAKRRSTNLTGSLRDLVRHREEQIRLLISLLSTNPTRLEIPNLS